MNKVLDDKIFRFALENWPQHPRSSIYRPFGVGDLSEYTYQPLPSSQDHRQTIFLQMKKQFHLAYFHTSCMLLEIVYQVY